MSHNQSQSAPIISTAQDNAKKKLQEMVNRWYGWSSAPSKDPGRSWRDDRTEAQKVIVEPDYFCCRYSCERDRRQIPIQRGPHRRGQPPYRKYRLGRKWRQDDIPEYLRNSY